MRRRSPLAGPALLCLAAACGTPLAPLPTAGAPRDLAYATFGFVPTLVAVRLAADTVVMTSQPVGGGAATVTRRVPNAAEWEAFWHAVADARVRGWPGECSRAAVETAGFRYELAWAGARRSGTYTNAWPTEAGACSGEDLAAVSRFRTAVLALAEGARPVNGAGALPSDR